MAAEATPQPVPYLKGMPIFGVVPEIRKDPLPWFLRTAIEHGPIVRLKMGPFDYYLLSDPAYARHVLQENQTNYEKSPFYVKLWPVFGQGLVTSEGSTWRSHRRTIQPSFRQKRLASFCAAMIEEAQGMCDAWAARGEGVEVELVDEMTSVVERILLRVIFGADLIDKIMADETLVDDFVFLNDEIGKRFFALSDLPEKLPFPRTLRFNRARERRVKMVDEMIAHRRAHPGEDDMLTALLEARDEETGEGLTDVELRDEVLTMFFAGHETTALALAWFWWALGNHPSVLETVQREAREVLGGDPEPGLELVGRFPELKKALQETMRLYPPAPWFSRIAVEDDEIAGVRIPKGAIAAVMPYVMHRNPRLWDEPDRFDPERFAPAEVKARDRFAYLPFGGGPRQCIGTHFAMMEATLIAAVVASRFDMKLVPGQEVRLQPMISLRPEPGVRVRLRSAER